MSIFDPDIFDPTLYGAGETPLFDPVIFDPVIFGPGGPGSVDPIPPGVVAVDVFAPFGSLGGIGYPWLVGLNPNNPVDLRAHLGTDLLLIAEPFQAAIEGSIVLDLFPPFGSLPIDWSTTVSERAALYVAATTGRSTDNDDIPSAVYVPGKLQPFNFGARLFEGVDPLSFSRTNEGVVDLIDPDNGLASLINRVWDGTPLILKRGRRGTQYRYWPIVGRYRGAGLVRDMDKKQIQMRDGGGRLDGELHGETYTGAGGIEGGANLAGQLKPWALGYNFNVEPVLLSASDQIFQWSLSSSVALTEFRHGGRVLAIDDDYPDYASLAAATIPSSQVATCLALSLVRPNVTLQYGVRVDVVGDADTVNGHPAPLTRAAIARRIATSRGDNRLDDLSEVDAASFSRMEAVHSAPVGWYFNGAISKAAALNRVMSGILGWWRVTPLGMLTVGWVRAPESLPSVVTLVGGRDDVAKPRLVATGLPRRGTRISWRTNVSPQPDRGSLSPLLTAEEADLYGRAATYGQSLSPVIASTWPTSLLVTIDDAGFRDEGDAVLEATRQQVIFSVVRNRWARDFQIDPFIDLLGSGVRIVQDPLSSGGDAVQLCVAIEAKGSSVQTLEFFT